MYCPAELNLGAFPLPASSRRMLPPCHASSADLLWHIWLLYYYLSIALRENILKANGSEIHGWWFMHHYISMVPKTKHFHPHAPV
jgi:hypothetical protein